MPREEKLKLGKGAAFVKSRLKRLRPEEETWEADFQMLPKPLGQNETHYRGLIVAKRSGSLLAETQIVGRPTVHGATFPSLQAGPNRRFLWSANSTN